MERRRIDAVKPLARLNHVFGAVAFLVFLVAICDVRIGSPIFLAAVLVAAGHILWFYTPRIYADDGGMNLRWRIRRRRILWSDIEDVFAFQTRLRIKYRETGITVKLKSGEHFVLPGCSAQYREIGSGVWGNDSIERRQAELAEFIATQSSVRYWRARTDSDELFPGGNFRLVQGHMVSQVMWIGGVLGILGGLSMAILMYVWAPEVGVSTIGTVNSFVADASGEVGTWSISYWSDDDQLVFPVDAAATAFVRGERVRLVYAAVQPDLATLPDARFDDVTLRPAQYLWFGLVGGPLLLGLGHVMAKALGSGHRPLERTRLRRL